jgi:hypothetical protein
MTNVPRSHGQWGGYRTSKAVAWVIDVSATDKAAWIARYKDQCSNPMPLKQAKAVASRACSWLKPYFSAT